LRLQFDSDDEREAAAAKVALGHKLEAQSKKKLKNKARLPRTAGLRTLSDLTADLTKAGIDPSRVQERAVMIAKVRAAGRKRRRDEGEEDAMDVDADGHGDDGGDGGDGGDWASEGEDGTMDVDADGENGNEGHGDTRHGHKRGKANSGTAIARKRVPRTNRQLAGLRDEAVRILTFILTILLLLPPSPLPFFSFFPLTEERGLMVVFFLLFFSFRVRYALRMRAASIQGGTTAESWSARTQYARKGGRKRPRYQSQNGASRGFFFSSSNRRDGCWPSCSQDSTWGGTFPFSPFVLVLAAVSTIPTFISILFFLLFSPNISSPGSGKEARPTADKRRLRPRGIPCYSFI